MQSNVVGPLVLCLVTLTVTGGPAMAQAPPPHKVWDVAASVGIAATSGNSDTSQFNAAYDLAYDPLTRNIFKSNALFLHGTTEGDVSAERFLFNVRDEHKISDRTYVFGNNLYLRDRFKSISYLDAVTGGVGYKLVASDRTKLDVDGGAGVAVSSRTQLKFEVVDIFKNKPPTAEVKKNDVATVVAIVFRS